MVSLWTARSACRRDGGSPSVRLATSSRAMTTAAKIKNARVFALAVDPAHPDVVALELDPAKPEQVLVGTGGGGVWRLDTRGR
jgi:hypothetical protein